MCERAFAQSAAAVGSLSLWRVWRKEFWKSARVWRKEFFEICEGLEKGAPPASGLVLMRRVSAV
eukprot:147844-Chlamydomonas_euryale.AAC.1